MILSGSFFKWTSFVGSAVCDPVGIRGSLHMKPGRFKVKKRAPQLAPAGLLKRYAGMWD